MHFFDKHRQGFNGLFLLLLLIEAYCIVPFSFFRLPYNVSSTLLFLSAIATGVLVLYFFRNKKLNGLQTNTRSNRIISISLLTAAFIVIGISSYRIFLNRQIVVSGSDIIPTVQLAVRRYLTGIFPYQTISEWGYQLPLTYLPAQWGPYIIAEKLDIDYRWIALAIYALASYALIIRNSGRNRYIAVILPLLLLGYWFMIAHNNENVIAITIELMIAGYYMMLIMGLAGRNAIIKGLVIGLCLLSRYSLVLWLPLWFFVELVSGNYKKLGVTILTILVFVASIYIVPFLCKDPSIFLKGYNYYTKAALGEWNHVDENGRPYHLYNGQGFAWLFYEKLHTYKLADRIRSIQKVHLLCSLLTTLLLGVWYWFNRNRINSRVFLLGSFKIYLAVFLAFIQVPYAYLMVTGTFVSIAIFAELSKWVVTATTPPASRPALGD